MGYAITAELERDMDGRTRFHRLRYHIARGFIDPMDKVLDLGCGTGYGSDMMSEVTLDVMSYDMEQSNIDYAEKNHNFWPIVYQVADLENIKIPDADVAVSFEVIEHLHKPKEFVDKLKKRIRKYIIVSVPLDQKLIWIEDKKEWQEVGDSTHHSAFTQDEFKNMFLDDKWKEFYSFRDGVTLICIFYNNDGLTKN
jgi:2-polyprenyl-3-methyl-5-hydroxy-6-metoxy-1,4-benzoquinol methylase